MVQAHTSAGQRLTNVPAALPAVPEQASPEPMGNTVRVSLDLPALLPAITVAGNVRVVHRLPASVLTTALSQANSNGSFGVLFPDGTTASYTLANPADRAALMAEIASGEPVRVEGRFLVDLLSNNRAAFEPLWERLLPNPVAFAGVVDELPSKAERYLYHVRLADPAGHISAEWALLPRLVARGLAALAGRAEPKRSD